LLELVLPTVETTVLKTNDGCPDRNLFLITLVEPFILLVIGKATTLLLDEEQNKLHSNMGIKIIVIKLRL
jgi:hypothetical protein